MWDSPFYVYPRFRLKWYVVLCSQNYFKYRILRILHVSSVPKKIFSGNCFKTKTSECMINVKYTKTYNQT